MQHNRARHAITGDPVDPVRRGPHRAPRDAPRWLESSAATLLRRVGYGVHRRPATHDQGLDLAVARPGLGAIVQCQAWRPPVGPSVVRDLYGIHLHTGADLGVLATTSTVGRSARHFARGKPLLILNGEFLQLLLPDST